MPVTRAPPPVQVPLELVGEDAQGARDERNRAVRVAAGAAACDLGEPPPQEPGVRRAPAALHELLQARGDRRETVHAWAALSRALLREIASDARRLRDAARVGGKSHDR